MLENGWSMPAPSSWITWCTYDWNEANDNTRVAFNLYCNELLREVNSKWKAMAIRARYNMIDICTISDEVFVITKVIDNWGEWLEIFSKRIEFRDCDGSVGGSNDASVMVGKKGKRKAPSKDQIDAENTLIGLIEDRRSKLFAKRWCSKVRTVHYNEANFVRDPSKCIMLNINSLEK